MSDRCAYTFTRGPDRDERCALAPVLKDGLCIWHSREEHKPFPDRLEEFLQGRAEKGLTLEAFDLSGAFLRHANLAGLDLTGVSLCATDLALACDFRLGVKGMRFFMPAARFGLHYYPSGLRRYTQKVSPSFAKRAFLLSEDFSDADLLAVGYLDWLVERVAFPTKIDEIADRLATLAPLSMVNMKRAIEQFAQAEPDIPSIRQSMNECATSEDLREGLAALRERRPPTFKGR